MKYRIGDKLICKKTYHQKYNNIMFDSEFVSGEEYKILSVDDSLKYFPKISYRISSIKNGLWFPIDRIYDYFYTLSEIRKIKLNKTK